MMHILGSRWGTITEQDVMTRRLASLPAAALLATLSEMDAYDYIFAGGGMAGLSLAYALVTGPQPDARILIVDPEQKGENDRTWSYWTRRPERFDDIVYREWSAIEFASHSWSSTIDLEEYRYCMIRANDFYDRVLDTLDAAPGVEFQRGEVSLIEGDSVRATVTTDAGKAHASYVFDSRFDPAEYAERSGPHHYLKQHFLGWVVESEQAVFQPGKVTMFDFRTPQHDEMRFVYILPFSATTALVEYTLFSADLLDDAEYVTALERYLTDVLGLSEYRVLDREKGVIPMTDEPVRRVENPRTLAIGTRGGRVKASTGYAFLRTQHDTDAIVRSIEQTGAPFTLPRPPARTRALDTTMLQIMYRRGGLSERTFTNLFRRNPIDRLFRFLDEEAGLLETLALMATVPIGPFLRAFWRALILRKV
jgi:lycopene beta-cyclase